jgi:hypothetical protein
MAYICKLTITDKQLLLVQEAKYDNCFNKLGIPEIRLTTPSLKPEKRAISSVIEVTGKQSATLIIIW